MPAKALILGITGGFGAAMAHALAADGWSVSALMRRPRGLPKTLENVPIVIGDARDSVDVARAAQGVDAIVQGFNVPYPRWRKDWPEANKAAMRAAAASGATILLPGNIYNYGLQDGLRLAETTAQNPDTRKGALRKHLEQDLAKDAAQNGYRVLVLRASDFFGPSQNGGWFDDVITKKLDKGVITYPASLSDLHSWAYLPDLAEAGLRLLNKRETFAIFETFHFHGHANVSGSDFVGAVKDASGRGAAKVKNLPWGMMSTLGRFVPMMREINEMRWLWQYPHELIDDKLRRAAPDLTHTPLHEAVAATLKARGKLIHGFSSAAAAAS